MPPGMPDGWLLAFPNTSIPQFKGKALFSLNTAGNGIIITSDSGWTGFLHINGIAVPPPAKGLKGSASSMASIVNNTGIVGMAFSMDIQIYPDPSPKSKYVNTPAGKTVVTWDKSPTLTTVGYEVYFNGGKVCSVKTTTCTLNQLVGPKSTMSVVAIGGAKTRSVEAKPAYLAGKYALALTVHYDTLKAILKPIDIKALDYLIRFVKREGYKQVFVVGHTDQRLPKSNLPLAKARSQAVIAYLAPRLKGVSYTTLATEDKTVFAKGNSKTALALNRRAEVFVK